jgi:hypothetical protein
LAGLILHLRPQQLDLPPHSPLGFVFVVWVVTEDREGKLTRHHEGGWVGQQIGLEEIKAVFE